MFCKSPLVFCKTGSRAVPYQPPIAQSKTPETVQAVTGEISGSTYARGATTMSMGKPVPPEVQDVSRRRDDLDEVRTRVIARARQRRPSIRYQGIVLGYRQR